MTDCQAAGRGATLQSAVEKTVVMTSRFGKRYFLRGA
jgi:hypothetical protein